MPWQWPGAAARQPLCRIAQAKPRIPPLLIWRWGLVQDRSRRAPCRAPIAPRNITSFCASKRNWVPALDFGGWRSYGELQYPPPASHSLTGRRNHNRKPQQEKFMRGRGCSGGRISRQVISTKYNECFATCGRRDQGNWRNELAEWRCWEASCTNGARGGGCKCWCKRSDTV
jgi:hypothetical protein